MNARRTLAVLSLASETVAATLFWALALVGVATLWASDAHAQSAGEYLARAGNCVVCHTASDGKPFAGGLKMQTPLGASYTTNITPDPETGIGNYTLEDFDRAMRQGVTKQGYTMYPAMPYPSYAKLRDDDIRSLYEFFMKEVAQVRKPNQSSEIPWPLSMRWPLKLWAALMVDEGVYRPKQQFDDEWNRGAYLVQGLGHCGACHTPRGWAFQEKALDEMQSGYLTGANLDHWFASNLTGDANAGLGRWTQADIVKLLKEGRNRHGAVFGTMTDVVNNSTQYLTDPDLNGIAKYLKSLPPTMEWGEPAYTYDKRSAELLRTGQANRPGAALYVRQCMACHGHDGQGYSPHIPSLAGNPVTMDRDPASLVNIVLNGSSRIVIGGVPDIYRMPPFRSNLNDQDIAGVLDFIRNSWGNRAAPVPSEAVASVREGTTPTGKRATILRMR